ncbi:aldo-keto reductase family 1 member B7-like isoform X2 [Thrips palmi]|uniref:Aldo-keto reductase family 1 member B7-like isoform X1 n=1 Tax=Thrips palmi TaxID=161013 RepID=A0A6P8ZHR9_THRPL|nr:aldo-keto reductase family 1 member B7-like isoform X1 [Thrips palmi]XP_034232334.1 aldo-keto reductase family 1 member B7-like isoform X2 [Thrips palmi]
MHLTRRLCAPLSHFTRMKSLGLFAALTVLAAHSAALRASDVPAVALSSGGSMPLVGLGTWQVTGDRELEQALDAALEAGYRHIDTATIYNNEHLIGKVLKRWLSEGKVKREDLFISTKLPVYAMRAADVPDLLNQSLSRLQLDYVDMYLIHMPFGVNRESYNGVSIVAIGPNDTDPSTDHRAIWDAMVAEKEAGRARALGVSNFNESQIERLVKHSAVPPANLQVELHLFHQQKPLVEFCKKNSITVTAFSPIGSPGSKWLIKLSGKELPDLLNVPEVLEIAKKHRKTAAQVLLRHILQKGIAVIPKSSTPARVRQNIDILDFSLDDEDVASLDSLDKGIDGKLFIMKNIGGSVNHPEYPWTKLQNEATS